MALLCQKAKSGFALQFLVAITVIPATVGFSLQSLTHFKEIGIQISVSAIQQSKDSST